MLQFLLIVFGSQIIRQTKAFGPPFMPGPPLMKHHLIGHPHLMMHGPTFHPVHYGNTLGPSSFGPNVPLPPHFFQKAIIHPGPGQPLPMVLHPKKMMMTPNIRPIPRKFVQGPLPSQNFPPGRFYPPTQHLPQQEHRQAKEARRIVIIRPRFVPKLSNRPEGHVKPRLVPYSPDLGQARMVTTNENYQGNNVGGQHYKARLAELPVFNDNSWNFVKPGGVDLPGPGPGSDARRNFGGPQPNRKGTFNGPISSSRNGNIKLQTTINKNINLNGDMTNSMKPNNFRFSPPSLREVIDTNIKIQISENSIEATKTQNAVSSSSLLRKDSGMQMQKGLAGKTLDFTGSTVIGSSSSSKLSSSSSSKVGSSSSSKGGQSANSSEKSFIDSGLKNHLDLSKVQAAAPKPKVFHPGSGLGGSLLDFTGMGSGATKTVPEQIKTQVAMDFAPGLDTPIASASAVLPSRTDSASASASAGMSTANAAAELGGNILSSATDLLGTGDVVIIDNSGQTAPIPTDLGAPAAAASLSNVIDFTGSSGSLNGGNIGDFGAVDVVTLDNAAFAQLEKALQSGQSVSSQFLDSIIGGGAGGAAGTSFIDIPLTSTGPGQGTLDLGPGNAAAPQIYLLDGAQAQQISGAIDMTGVGSPLRSGTGGPPHHVVDVHVNTSSSSSTASKKTSTSSKQSSKSSSTHSIADIPHAGAIMPVHGQVPPGSHGSHDVIGVVGEPVGSITVGANTDIVGLFNVPGDPHFADIPASVANIPKSIGHKMQGQG